MKKLLLLFSLSFFSPLPSQNPGIVIKNMDPSVKPGDNFYLFCNGHWQSSFKLPESDARYGSFNEIYNNNLKRIKIILDELSKNPSAPMGSDHQRIKDFYLSGMDSLKLDQERHSPLMPLLRKIDSLKSYKDLVVLKAEFDAMGIPLFFTLHVAPDLKNSERNIVYLMQSGYGMGDREYYHLDRYKDKREAYLTYLYDLFYSTEPENPGSPLWAEEVLIYERNLTYEALSKQDLRETEKTYNRFSKQELQQLMPSFNWDVYFQAKGMTTPDTLVLTSVNYMKQADVLLSRAPLPILKMYVKGQLLMAAAPFLSSKYQYVDFLFRGKVMSGTREIKPRWERVYKAMDTDLGEMFSKEYVHRHFSPEAKAKVNRMIDQLVIAYRKRIASRDWMSPQSKAMANKKLDRMIRKIAYPEIWKTYKGLEIARNSYWDNVCRARRWAHADLLSELKKPVDRNKWQMTPVTVNAYYDPSTNEITFPAGILQPPFFDAKADDAANYGTMGSIIGHELSHGFDDEGAKFDANGNLKMWWSENDYKQFKERSARLAEQYNAYVLLDSLHVNGQLTLGENIADLGGVTLSYLAYKNSLGANTSKLIEGYSGEQRFFIAWTQGWKTMVRDEELKRLLRMDYHAPAYIRSFAPLTNLKEFHEAFGIQPGHRLYRQPSERVEIW